MRRSKGYREPTAELRRRMVSIATAFALMIVSGGVGWAVGRTADLATSGTDIRASIFYKPMPMHAKTVVVPAPPDSLLGISLPNNDSAVTSWAEAYGGGAADGVYVSIALYGAVDHPLIIERIQAAPQCSDPGGGHRTVVEDITAGPFEGKLAIVDLDSARLDVIPAGWETASDTREWAFPLQVSKSEAERVDIQAFSGRDCDFYIDVYYRSAGESKTLRVANEGRPFAVRTSSAASGHLKWRPSADYESVLISR